MSVLVVRSDARRLPLHDNSVDLIVTSPPYFALRSYQDGGEHYAGQVGDESTPAEFVDALIACTREWMRVLKPSGSLWVNLGDKYAAAGGGGKGSSDGTTGRGPRPARRLHGTPAKSLYGLPWRYALACIDDLGLILRAEVIWSKPNGLPESVTDRVRRSHETWFHFTREPRYFSAVDEIREPHKSAQGREGAGCLGGQKSLRPVGPNSGAYNTLGALPGSVWTIPTQPLQVPASLGIDHFAAFPMEWPRRIIRGWSPSGICTACGEGRRPVAEVDLGRKERHTPAYGAGNHGTGGSTLGSRGPSAVITGEFCACAEPTAPTRPSVVLDPFGGTGTTALVASTLGRIGISNDLSHDYCRLAKWRTTDRRQIAAAMLVTKPEPEVDGQGDLFGGAA